MEKGKAIFEIGEKMEDILSRIVSNSKFVPLATGLALSGLGITVSLSSGDHSQLAFAAANHAHQLAFAAANHAHQLALAAHAHQLPCHVIGVCPTKAIFW